MEVTFYPLKVKNTFMGDKQADWGEHSNNWNNHMISIRNLDTQRACAFEYWTDIGKPEIETEKELLTAFLYLVNNAILGKLDFATFCLRLDYSEDSRKAHKEWQVYKKANDKLWSVYKGDIFQLAEDLRVELEK